MIFYLEEGRGGKERMEWEDEEGSGRKERRDCGFGKRRKEIH
jgi:hypothetical protein